MYEDYARIESRIRELQQLLLTADSPAEAAKYLTMISNAERIQEKIKGDIEEYREEVEEERAELTAREQRLFDSIYGENPVIREMIENNINNVSQTARNLGFSQVEIDEITTNYVQDSTRVREDHVKEMIIIIEQAEVAGIDAESTRYILEQETLHAEDCHSQDILDLQEAFRDMPATEENRELFEEQLNDRVTNLENDYYRLDLTMNSLNEFKLSEEYEKILEANPDSPEAIKEAYLEFMNEKIMNLPPEEKEKLELFENSDQLYSYYLYDHIDGGNMELSEFLEGEKLEQLQEALKAQQERAEKHINELESLTFEDVNGTSNRFNDIEISEDITSGLASVTTSPENEKVATYTYSDGRVQEIQEERTNPKTGVA